MNPHNLNEMLFDAESKIKKLEEENVALKAKNVALKAKIAGGVRVYVEYGDEHEMFINETAVSENMKNATLLLDDCSTLCHEEEPCFITDSGECSLGIGTNEFELKDKGVE